MRALTIWQPWASFIMAGAKPYEFRPWDYRRRVPDVEGQRIVIHAGARPIKRDDIEEIIERIREGESSLNAEIVLPICKRLMAAHKCQGLPLASGLGTAILGRPRDVNSLFKKPDSDRLYAHMWAWPLTDIQPFVPVVPMRGFQGFWNWPGTSAP